MGCVKDEVPLEHFIMKMVQFQKISGAEVNIVTYNQVAHRVLRMGLSHHEFMRKMRALISHELLKPSNYNNQPVAASQDPLYSSIRLLPAGFP